MYRDLRWVTISEAASRVASFVTVPMLARSFSPFRYGFYRSLFLILSIFLTVEGILQFRTILEKRLPEMETGPRKRLTISTLTLAVAASIFAFCLLFITVELGVLQTVFPDIDGLVEPYYAVLGALFVTYPIYRITASVCKGVDRFPLFSLTKIVREGGFLTVVVVLFLYDSVTIGAVLWGYVLFTLISIVIIFGRVEILSPTSPDYAELVSNFRHISVPLVPNSIMKQVQGKIPEAIILASFGPVTFATWTILFTFVRVFQLFSQPFSQLFLTKISARLADDRTLDPLLLNYYRYSIVISVPLVVGGGIIGPELIYYLFGSEYAVDTALLVLLLGGFGLQTIGAPAGQMFVATESPFYASITMGFRGILYLIVTILGAYLFNSLVIVALGYLLGYVFVVAFSLWYQSRFITLPPLKLKPIGQMGSAILCMSGVALVGRPVLTGLIPVLLTVAVAGVTYFAVLYLTGFLDNRDIDHVKRLVGA